MPYTAAFPKPLIPLDDMPILEVVIRQLVPAGITSIVLATGYKHDLITSYFGDGSSLGVDISYLVEDRPMGTCGAVFSVLDTMSEDFLVMNSDILTDLAFGDLFESHANSGSAITMATKKLDFCVDYGVVEIGDDNRVQTISEKPTYHHNIGMGIYVLNKHKIDLRQDPETRLDMPDLIKAMIAKGARVSSFSQPCQWIDIGTPENYLEAHRLFSENRDQFL